MTDQVPSGLGISQSSVLDALKINEPETKSQHVETITPPNAEEEKEPAQWAHMPAGVSETDEEKQNHWFIGSIDQGTTSSRFIIFNGDGVPVVSHQIEFENMYPESG